MPVIRVIDFETTAEKLPAAQVCEVGICDLDLDGRTIGPVRSWLCGVGSMDVRALAVHHIMLADCANKPSFRADMLFEGKIDAVAAHGAEFETQFFESPVPVICTYKSALIAWPEAPGHSNSVLRYWLEMEGKTQPDRARTLPVHRAGPDAYVTAHTLLALFNEGFTGAEMVAFSKDPPVLPRCPIGKFRDKPWSEVEIGFLRWMLSKDDMEDNLKWNAQRELDRRKAPPVGQGGLFG